MSEWIFPDHDPVFDEPVDLGRLESWTALARARKGDDMSTHDYRVRKRRMCQAIGLPTSTTVAQLKEAWAAEGLRWPADDEITDVEHINIEQFRTNDKENDMTKNTQPTLIDIPTIPAPKSATTKPAKKENTVEKKNTKPNFVEFAAKDVKGPEWTTTTIAMQDAAVAAVRAAYGDETDLVPVNFVKELKAQRTGKAAGKLNRNQSQIDDLAVVSRDLGFTDPRFCNEHEVDDIKGGKIKDGAFGFLMYFPIGSSIKWYYVFNIEDIEYEGDEPTLVEEDEKPKADPKPKAKTNTTTPKPDPKLKKLEEELAAQKKANDEMRELLAAQKASTDQMTAMFTALMAKLG